MTPELLVIAICAAVAAVGWLIARTVLRLTVWLVALTVATLAAAVPLVG